MNMVDGEKSHTKRIKEKKKHETQQIQKKGKKQVLTTNNYDSL